MDGPLARLTDADLLYLSDRLAPGADRGRMLRVLREDEDILRAMVADERLLRMLTDEPEGLLCVSPRLVFSVLMERVKRDLQELSYTVERGRTVVFDVPRITRLLSDRRLADYLVEVLASFVRVQSATFTVRVRRGVWARYRYSDLDPMSLIRYTKALEESERHLGYRRIGDLCLFLNGVFPDATAPSGGYVRGLRLSREALAESGRGAYRAAARHPRTEAPVAELLARLADTFDLAVKPLDHMASRYLGKLRDRFFEPAKPPE
jgi:hypothetical protein